LKKFCFGSFSGTTNRSDQFLVANFSLCRETQHALFVCTPQVRPTFRKKQLFLWPLFGIETMKDFVGGRWSELVHRRRHGHSGHRAIIRSAGWVQRGIS